MNIYKQLLLNRLHKNIQDKNKIENETIRLLTYDVTIEPKIVELEEKSSVLCSVYFYIKAPIIGEDFYEYCSVIANDKYKAIELVADDFVYCAFNGMIDFLNGVSHHEIDTYILGNKKRFSVCESPIIGLGSSIEKEKFYNEYVKNDDSNNYSSFLWYAISREIPFMLANTRVNIIKVYGAKMPDGEIVTECYINNNHSESIENAIIEYIDKWDNKEEFFSIKQFFFILQYDYSYKKYPYTREEIEYFVIEYVLEFEKSHQNYEMFINNIKNIITDKNIREEIINFVPEICTENAFKDIRFDERVKVNIGSNNYTILKSQFTSYKYIEDALIDGFSNKIFKEETFNNLIHISNSYNTIYEAMQNNIKTKDIIVSTTFNFTEDYQYI
ncbi:TPR domain-containing protein [Brachyspira pilosicoli WesB]|uniref:TPR domain-containing protein n=1 Tax=Brachyspira pilosicoli WesB TaxID=1161918 RepID=K0JL06_BRAPL|nr:DUF6348 family protein [Brachyspira pilosicoli]CCG57020.1 TPR domain-containing protein [Brachyspira pilosicoli WesB]